MAKESTREDRMRVLVVIAEPVECALTGAGRKESKRSLRKRLFKVAARRRAQFPVTSSRKGRPGRRR